MTLPIVVYTSETARLIMALKRNETNLSSDTAYGLVSIFAGLSEWRKARSYLINFRISLETVIEEEKNDATGSRTTDAS